MTSIEALSQGLAALPGLIPEIRAYRFGPDAGLETGNTEFGVVADFDDVGLRRPSRPPDVVDRQVAPMVDRRTAGWAEPVTPGSGYAVAQL